MRAKLKEFFGILVEIEKMAEYVDSVFDIIKSELGEEIIIPAHKLPILKVSESFKNQVN